MLRAAIDFRFDILEIRQPSPTRPVMCVADIIAGYRLLSADFANSCHDFLSCFLTPQI
jgi:hypothetical protein